ncbi:hypothetical protein THRCLA_20229 [Thraustotheca clavata]|uniref:Late endosomal/lysosomal adaptor and MAPK and MTOR activator 4 n=1 Tax=Thraustotheca clavata TaxID=74557 RepID=A0A1W0AA26_9STRA|nr:hypothetical protein THRCLA_20229 [Thraustotheca clavata]
MSGRMETLLATPNQVGVLIADREGTLVSASGDLDGSYGERVLKTIRLMLLDCGNLQFLKKDSDEHLERLTVSYPTYQYNVTMDEQHIYIVKQVLEEVN